jgi:hypothetical protein
MVVSQLMDRIEIPTFIRWVSAAETAGSAIRHMLEFPSLSPGVSPAN